MRAGMVVPYFVGWICAICALLGVCDQFDLFLDRLFSFCCYEEIFGGYVVQ
jgi:hypothetical protein